MERITLIEEFDNNAVRFRTARTVSDRKLYGQIIDNILDEWNRAEQPTTAFEPVEVEPAYYGE